MTWQKANAIYLREKTWWLDFRHNGKRHVERLGKNISKTAARELAKVARGKILTGEAGIGEKKKKDIPIEQAIDEFLDWVKTNKRENTWKGYKWNLAQIKKSVAGKRLGDIAEVPHIQNHKKRRMAEDCLVACNRELSALQALYTWSIKHKKFDGPNPVDGVAKFEESSRVRFLDADEEAALMAELSEPHRTMVLLGIHTGLRLKSEALTLRWASVSLERGAVTVDAAYAKNKETRTVKLNSTIRAALAQMKRGGPGMTTYSESRTASVTGRSGPLSITP